MHNKPAAIVYTSNTGFTAAYARLLQEKTGLPLYSLDEARASLPKDTPVVYMGWLMAGTIRGCLKASKRFRLCVVCGVGLGDTGSQLEAVRKSSRIAPGVPLFTLQGGMDHAKLKGIYKSMIGMLTKAMSAKKNRTEDEEKMLALLLRGGNYVSETHLTDVLAAIRESEGDSPGT